MPSTADIIIHNARGYTVDPINPQVQAVAVKGNTIIAVGSDDDVLALRGPRTRLINGEQRTLLPGFIDSHFHLLHGSLALNDMQLEGIKDLAELTNAIHQFRQENPNRDRYLGYGLTYNILPNHQYLTRHHLDDIMADRPLLLFAFDFHTAWANTPALQQLGWLNGGPPDIDPNILRGADGLAGGALIELNTLILTRLPQPTLAQKRAMLNQGLAACASLGITGVHNMDGDMERMALYAALDDVGELTLRVYCPYDITPETSVDQLVEAVTMRDTFNSAMLRGGCVKFFMDGVIESRTGFVLDAYPNEPDNHGLVLYSAEHFNRMAIEADRLGLQIFVHAVGDAAVRRVLDGYQMARQSNGPRDSRHRVEHIELCHPDDLPRFAQLGVIASMQPYHCPLGPFETPDAWVSNLSQQQLATSFPWQSLRDAGAHVTFGSDWPVVTFDPFKGLHTAVNRLPMVEGHPDQRQTLAQAIAAYNAAAAYAEFQEDKKGQLKPGLWADMVLLDGDIFAIPPEELADVRPLLTVCNGRIVHEVAA